MSGHILKRKITLLQATAINMTEMVGIGPFVVLSVVAEIMKGPSFLYAWLAGAFLAFIDAMVCSELGAAFPLAGGSYNFLKEGYGPKWGRLMSFLFVWQTMIQAPLVIASAAIGFSKYFGYLVQLSTLQAKMVSGGVVMLIVLLLYRKIETIGKISILLWACVLGTIAWVIGSGVVHGNFLQPVLHVNEGLTANTGFAALLGLASIKTVYSYLGYYNVCHLGGEIINPHKNIPRSMFISIAAIALLYLLMNISVASVLPYNTIIKSDFVVSEFVQTLQGNTMANVVTVLILIVAFASVFSGTLGYTRVPYAAAKDGSFFKIFARLHSTKDFPYVSLIALGGIAFLFSIIFNNIAQVVHAILAMRILTQFVAQAAGLVLLHKEKRKTILPWKMPLYPLPVIIDIIMWIALFCYTGWTMIDSAVIFIAAGIAMFFIKAKINNEWPFRKALYSDMANTGTEENM
ncbi:MAG TPA: amino acid permease [Chitinophagaceae bacterium]|nr:amino acid permease [Chitinophagaceae bacterium]